MKKRRLFLIGLIVFSLLSIAYVKYYKMNINDIGLSVLTWVKKLKGNAVDLNAINNTEVPIIEHHKWTELLQKHVSEAGEVDYKGFIKDSILLDEYLTILSEHPTGSNWNEEEKIAYWINAYNAFTVKLIVEHYPLKSIKDISDGLPMINSPWDMKFFKIGKVDFDLNTIEHEILRKEFNEPRIHFAINCASISCPKLRNEAFTAAQLDIQLDDQAKQFIIDPSKNEISDKAIKLSKIFDWFKSDFTKKQSLSLYLQTYSVVQLSDELKIEYLEYDWNLNE